MKYVHRVLLFEIIQQPAMSSEAHSCDGDSSKQCRSHIAIVLARFNEQIKWIQKEEFNDMAKTVYNKGSTDISDEILNCHHVRLRNVGREGQLAIVMFLQMIQNSCHQVILTFIISWKTTIDCQK